MYVLLIYYENMKIYGNILKIDHWTKELLLKVVFFISRRVVVLVCWEDRGRNHSIRYTVGGFIRIRLWQKLLLGFLSTPSPIPIGLASQYKITYTYFSVDTFLYWTFTKLKRRNVQSWDFKTDWKLAMVEQS